MPSNFPKPHTHEWLLIDQDGDKLTIQEVYGMGERMLCIAIEQEGDFCGVNLPLRNIPELIRALQSYMEPGHAD